MHAKVSLGPSASRSPPQHPHLLNFKTLTNIPVAKLISPPTTNVNEPSSQCMLECAKNTKDDPIIYEYQAFFPRSSCVTSMRKISVTSLVK